MNKKTKSVLRHICENPGTTQANIIKRFGGEFFNTTSEYGSQRQASTIIVRLRKAKLVQDVSRCSTCCSAQTGRKPNTPLHATAEGRRYVEAMGEPETLTGLTFPASQREPVDAIAAPGAR